MLLWCTGYSTVAQTTDGDFGQNRVQYKDFVWSFYQTEHFMVYFYLGGQDVGKFTILDAEKELTDIENKTEYKLNDRVDILVYNNLSDLKQSNIGYGADLNNTGGTTKILGNKMFVYFDGNHQHLREQIREGIASIFLQNMMFGGSIQEVVQNAVLLKLPPWFKDGLTSYIGQSWNTDLDNKLRDGILSEQYKKMNRLSGTDARFAGHAVWHYIAEKYGEATIPNLLYLTRINRSMESGFSFVLGKSVKDFLEEFYLYYDALYKQELAGKEFPSEKDVIQKRERRGFVFNQLHVTNDASNVAFVRNDLGKYKVCLKDLKSEKTKTLFKGGFKNITQPIDYTQPVLAFDPTGKKLAIVYEKRSKVGLIMYDLEEKKKDKRYIANFQKVLSISFSDANTLVLSAINRGQSDIFTLNTRSSKFEQITNDFYDDLNPHYIKLPTRQGIVFSSNRQDDTLRTRFMDTIRAIKNYDLFFYNTKTKSKELVRVNHTPAANENNPSLFNTDYFSYLSDENGISNRYIAYIDSLFDHYDQYYYFKDSTVVNPAYNIDSVITSGKLHLDSTQQVPVYRDTVRSFPQTNYSKSILEQDVATRAGKIAQVLKNNGRYEFSLVKIPKEVDRATLPVLTNTAYANQLLRKMEPTVTIPVVIPEKPKLPEIQRMPDSLKLFSDSTRADTSTKSVQNSYFFQSEFSISTTRKIFDTSVVNSSNKKQPAFRYSKILPYNVKFSTSQVVTQLDNSLIITRYQPFNGNGGQFDNPNLGALLRVGISDLMEDYRITGGFRFPTSFDGTEYYLMFEDLKHRLDKRYTAYRRSKTVAYDANPQWYLPVNAKQRTYLADFTLRYPIDYNRSLRLSTSYRNERINYLATDSFSLGLAQYTQHWAVMRLEYVFDNTLKIQTNIYDGLRYKFYVDAQRQIDQKNTYLFAAGADFRYYKKITRNLIWATRLNGATSWGDQKVVYYMGGVDNWFDPKFSTETPVDGSAGYAFQTLAVNVRGFPQNIRNGNSYALANTEIRFPVFSFFITTPIRSELVRNFQLVAFADAGTAWQGISPYDENNPFNSSNITQGPVTVHVNYFREPVVVGYGGGARTTILGYFLRVDCAQGIDSGARQKVMWMFSMGTDF
ncbi:MAG: hypothetical protein IPO83_10595 [Chitinophagaceae bacterium]|nr:hypothetical protein [Chitinophagaceae bacterium]